MCLIQTGEIAIGYINELGIFHGLNKIVASFTCDKTPERNNKLVLRKEEDILLFGGLRITVINTENALHDKPEIVTYHMLHIKKVAFFDATLFPKAIGISNILVGQCCKTFQMYIEEFMMFIHYVIFFTCRSLIG
jgi:hypothetical protein